jgi:hypothetical protein
MEKLEEKKKKSFLKSKAFLFTVMSVFVLGLASALIVNYMSEKAEVVQSVDYAMVVQFAKLLNDEISSPMPDLSIEGDWVSELSVEETVQLNTEMFGVKVTNRADVPIENKYLQLVVSNNLSDVSCDDITSLQFLDTATQTQLDKGYQELKGLCISLGNEVVYNIPINSLASDEEYQYPAKVTYGIISPATYTFEAQMVVNPTTI